MLGLQQHMDELDKRKRDLDQLQLALEAKAAMGMASGPAQAGSKYLHIMEATSEHNGFKTAIEARAKFCASNTGRPFLDAGVSGSRNSSSAMAATLHKLTLVAMHKLSTTCCPAVCYPRATHSSSCH